jgi:TonB family protein
MNFWRPLPLLVFLWVGLCCAPQALAQAQTQTNEKATDAGQQPLKLLKSPVAPFPIEALQKQIEGKVQLSLLVDAEGRVSDATILSGPPEFYQSALDSVKQWQFSPPAHAPTRTNAEVSFFYNHPCPGPVSTMGSVTPDGRLTSEKGTIVDVIDDPEWLSPRYFPEERKAGIEGEMVLSVTVDAKGRAKKIAVVKSLSPRLDQAAIKAVRTWKFKLKDGSPDSLPDVFPLHIKFQPECFPNM